MENTTQNDDLQKTLNVLASKGKFGVVWLDDQLVTRKSFGELGRWIPVGQNICESTPLFLGMESELLQLQDEPENTVSIPKVGLKVNQDSSVKLSIEINWDEVEQRYILMLHNISSQSDLDHELAKQVRARRIAEENYQKARKQVLEQLGLLGLIMDHAPAAVAIFDDSMTYLFATQCWLRLFCIDKEPVIGRNFYDVHKDASDELREHHQACLQGKQVSLETEKRKNSNGGIEWIRQGIRPWRKEGGSVGGVIIVAEILTQLIEKRRTLEEKNQDLLRANQELEEFASIISHDLKTPLRSIRSEAEQLVGADVTEGVAEKIRLITQHSERMGSMLDDLFEYSHVARKSVAVQPVDLEKVVQEIASVIPGANCFSIRHEGLAEPVLLPLAPFDLVVRNIFVNAITHHDLDKGEIVFRSEDRGEHWLFEISDDGPGIEQSIQSQIFLPFHVGNGTKLGNGIGLALVKKAVELHGGDVRVVSDPSKGRGTQFIITWPKIFEESQ